MSYSPSYEVSQVGFAWEEEATYKTRPANVNNWLRVIKQEIPWPEREPEVIHAYGAGREPHEINAKVKWKCEGNFEAELFDGQFLGAILGDVQSAGSSPYTHTITVLNGILPSFSIQVPFVMTANNLVAEFLGCRVNTASFSAAEDNEALKVLIEYMAAKPQDGGASPETITEDTTEPYAFKEGVFSSTALYAGAKARVYSFSLKVNNQCKPDYPGGNEYYPYDIIPGKLLYDELNMDVGLEDDAEWDEVIASDPNTVYDYEYLFTRGSNDTIKFSGNAKFKGAPPKLDENNVRAQLKLLPYTLTITVVDNIETYPFE